MDGKYNIHSCTFSDLMVYRPILSTMQKAPSYDITEDDIDSDVYAVHVNESLVDGGDASVLNDLREYYIQSDSPLTLSSTEHGNSGDDEPPVSNVFNEAEDKLHHIYHHHSQLKYKKLTYQEIEQSLNTYYDNDNKYANELSVLTTFVKGQKHLYMQAKYVTQIKLYMLIFSAMLISAASAILSAVYVETGYERNISVACMNAVSAILIYVMNYLKLESTISMYMFISAHYDKLENSLEFTHNRLLFVKNEAEQSTMVLEKIQDVEFKMTEIKDIVKIHLPKEIGRLFPLILYVNVFAFIKKMEVYKKNLILQYRDVKNEIRYILHKWNTLNHHPTMTESSIESIQRGRERARITCLSDTKDRLKHHLIHYKDAYTQLDEILTQEIKYAESFTLPFYLCVCWFSPPRMDSDAMNPMIRDILHDR